MENLGGGVTVTPVTLQMALWTILALESLDSIFLCTRQSIPTQRHL